MGNGCCKEELENNPDGSPKDPQTKEQVKDDPADLRRWAKDGDSVELERLLKRMPAKAIRSGAKKTEGVPEEEDNTALHFAATRGSLPCVELLVLYGAGVNSRGAKGATPLHSALEGGRRQVAHFLLEHGADINATNKAGASAFLSVLLSGRKRLSSWLLERCGDSLDVGATDRRGVGPCTVAARHGWWGLLGELIAKAQDAAVALNTRSSEGETPLGWVLKYGTSGLLGGEELAALVTQLLEKGASPSVPAFPEQIPPLCLAAATGNEAVLAALRSRGAILDPLVCCDSVRRNPLHYAAAKGHEAMCELLMREGGPGMQAHVADASGNTPLHLAALRGHSDVARALLEKSEDKVTAIMATNNEGISTYHLILQAGPDDKAQRGVLWILDRIGPDAAKTAIMDKERLLETPLLLAVASHQDQVVVRLLDQGHDPDEANAAGETPLSRCLGSATVQTAAADGAIFKVLVEKGAGMEKASGNSHPLLSVCKNPLSRFSEQVVELLLSQVGGDASALKWTEHADEAGRGPLHLAALHDNAFMVKYLLEQAKIGVDTPCAAGRTPLMYAAMGCSTNAIKVLLNRHADPRVTDPDGRSVLSYCLKLDRHESLACAAMLLVMGAKPDGSMDLRGEGLLHRAVRYGTSEFIRLWVRYGGDVCQLAVTDDTADDMEEELTSGAATEAVAAARRKRSGDYMDAAPKPMEVEEDEAEDGSFDLGSGKLDGVPAVAAMAAGDANSDGAADVGYGDQGKGGYSDAGVGGGSRAGSRGGSRVGSRGGSSGSDRGGLIKQEEPQPAATFGTVGFGYGASGRNLIVEEEEVMEISAASDGRLGRMETAGSGTPPDLASFSVPTGVAYGSSARAVAEAVEAIEAEVARYPSFCRRPSVLDIRRWARRGVAWFDDALPAVAHPELGPAGCPPSLPMPPDEDDEEAEESAIALEDEPELHPALDAEAIWRRTLLSKIKDRRQPAAVATVAAQRHSTSACGVAEATMGAAGEEEDSRALRGVGAFGAAAVAAGSRSGSSFVQGQFRRTSAAGASVADGGLRSSGAFERSASQARRSCVGAHDITSTDDWMQEITRSAESTMSALKRGSSITTDAAGGSGSRAVRAMMRSRRSLSPSEKSTSPSPPRSPSAAQAEAQALNKAKEKAGAKRLRGPGAVAEAREGETICNSDESEDSDNDMSLITAEGKMDTALEDLKDAGIARISKFIDKQVVIVDPYYKRGTRFKGVPRYMDEELVDVNAASLEELVALADELSDRLSRYPTPVDEPPLGAADLRERNIKWYNLGLSPSEYPMKPGQWKAALKKAKAAMVAARARVARKPGEKVVVRSRKAWFGLPAMPSRPELRGTSALTLAVRLRRPACVAALLSASLQPLNVPDGWGHTPVAYAAFMLARDKYDTGLQQVYDMLLEKLPQVNFTRLDPNDGNEGHSLLCPINLAVIAGDRSRLAHLVLRCAGAINNSWTALIDIPIYLQGTWEKLVAKCDSRCPAVALAVMTKRIDTVKLVLDLGANPNVFGESRDVRLKAKLAREYADEQELERRLQDSYEGVLSKARLTVMQKVTRLKRIIANIEIPGISKPHPFVTPLHLAARTGQAEVTFLLLRRGALANGGGSVPYAKKSPLQEALMYARSNFSTTNPGSRRKNWKEVRPAIEDIPPMSPAAVKKDADSKSAAIMRAMVDPTVMALKAVALAAKYAVNFLLEMRKRPIAHWDPALWTAHVLLLYRAPYDLSDTQTSIVLRDLMDNGKWKWMRRPSGHRFRVVDVEWTAAARTEIDTIKADPDIGYVPIGTTGEPKTYKSLKQQFVARADEAYFGSGALAMYDRYQQCSAELMEVQQQYVFEELQPAIMDMAEQAVKSHVSGASSLLEASACRLRDVMEAAAASLEPGVALDESGVMDCLKYERFALPKTVLPADIDADVAADVQAEAVERLRSQATRAAEREIWGRVMLWGNGGVFLGFPSDNDLQTLPQSDDDLKALARKLGGVDSDKLQESLKNLKEQLDVAAENLLAKMQESQEGLSNLLEVIGIDFLDVL